MTAALPLPDDTPPPPAPVLRLVEGPTCTCPPGTQDSECPTCGVGTGRFGTPDRFREDVSWPYTAAQERIDRDYDGHDPFARSRR